MPSSQNSAHPKNKTKRVKVAAHSSSAKQQNTPLLNLSKVPQDVEQAQSSQEKIYIPSIVEGNTGALTVKSSSPSWKKKIAIVTAGTVALIGAITGATALVHYITSQNGNKSNGISSPNNTLATTTDFTRNTINPYLKNATNSYSRAAANSSTPSFDAALKSLKTDSDFDKNSSEFAEYNRSFTELEELELQEQSNSTLTSVNSYLENSMGLSNSTYDESSEREPQAQEDNGRGRNRNRREKVIIPLAKSAIGSSLSSFSVLTSAINSAISALTPVTMSMPTSVPTSARISSPKSARISSPKSLTMPTPASTPKRYTLVLDPGSEPKTGDRMEQMQVNVVLKEITSRLTPGLCSFLVNKLKNINILNKGRVLTMIRSYSARLSEQPVHDKDYGNTDTNQVINSAKKIQYGCNATPCIRARKKLEDDKYLLFLEASFEDQEKFLKFFNEEAQRYDPELIQFGYDILLKYFIPRSVPEYRECLSRNNYRFEKRPEFSLNSKNGITVSFQVYDVEDKTITGEDSLCDLGRGRLSYLQSVAIAKKRKEILIMSAESMSDSDEYRLFSDIAMNGVNENEAVGEIITFEQGRGNPTNFIETSRITREGAKNRVMYKFVYLDGKLRLERKRPGYHYQDLGNGIREISTRVNDAVVIMDTILGDVTFDHDRSFTRWEMMPRERITDDRILRDIKEENINKPLPERNRVNVRSAIKNEDIERMGKYLVKQKLEDASTPSITNFTARYDQMKDDYVYVATIDASTIQEVGGMMTGAPGTVVNGVTSCIGGFQCCPETP